MTNDSKDNYTRRTVLAVGVAGAAGMALAACGGSDTATEATASAPADDPTTEATSSAPAADVTGTDVGPASQVAVGSAAILTTAEDTAFVVAQPEEGTFVAHSAVCTHQGCLCSRIDGQDAVCPCHGSKFNVVTGDVEQGPATRPLASANVTVSNGNLFVS
jgi:nitrite reductase/ring-hydroxylating ferredoxin subunit